MARYTVTIRNISARVDSMRVEKGQTATITVTADSPFDAMQSATKKQFDGCRFHSEGKHGSDGTQIGSITTGKMLYGRITVYAVEMTAAELGAAFAREHIAKGIVN